ncbi:IS91 family transposase (plasmid) [Mesorhizobium sp. AR02]|uniref:IS91 family transposase n=1 Tax=Mesorhizobium sp. AR02 TaxID=2865837 RepID=UPI00215EE0F6|nr:IS91 family transposase [Mesorhizobium sp. AR02]UVK49734.1 IS91 family transposase [Mesorhizobium sp. AR02]UVK49803.1 IS91 family transposase [Mesorhizobium sp. AR02]UVK49813.1 IS91 family transposase [Mesorhizobium sp. AR02]UVK50140.1 IS91 family transposase [Mesorhizobium sp. AR02]
MRPDLEVADVFHRHGDDYRRDHAGHLGRVERRVMAAVEACRTAALGGHAEHCTDCGLVRQAYNSCRNRHCPKCQGLARAQWLAERQAELLPVPYFHVVFTVPAQIAEIAFQNKAAVYAILFKAASEALRAAAADPRHLGAEIGVVAVLHTWGQNLHHHPHVHCVVPGGGLSLEPAPATAGDRRWIACRPGFFLPVRVLSRLFRRLFLEHLQDAFDAGQLRFFSDLASLADPATFCAQLAGLKRIEWVVYAKPPFGGPEQVLAYLGRYTHRVAIANSRLVSLDQGKVSFRWKDYRHHDKSKHKLMTLSADEFIRRFLLHALPDGFHRIRHYGLFANGHRVAKLAQCRLLLAAPTPPTPDPTADYRQRYRCLTGRSLDICPGCGGAMASLGPIPRKAQTWPDTS